MRLSQSDTALKTLVASLNHGDCILRLAMKDRTPYSCADAYKVFSIIGVDNLYLVIHTLLPVIPFIACDEANLGCKSIQRLGNRSESSQKHKLTSVYNMPLGSRSVQKMFKFAPGDLVLLLLTYSSTDRGMS